jgi:hypothetical protein
VTFDEVLELPTSVRGSGGYGSTGLDSVLVADSSAEGPNGGGR